MKFILGKKLNMTQVWVGEEAVAVTRVQAGPCVVAQVKTQDKDGYSAVQLGFGKRKEKNIKKPQKNHLKGLGNFSTLREFRLGEYGGKEVEVNRGDVVSAGTFAVGDIIDVRGTSKGKGFQGGVKRYGFSGQESTHGTKDQVRMPGSIGAKGPARVFKGTRMAGHTGADIVTTKNLEIIEVDEKNNILFIKGAVPGSVNGLLEIRGEGELKTISSEQLTIDNNKKEESVSETVEAVEVPAAEAKAEEVKAEVVEEVKGEEIKN